MQSAPTSVLVIENHPMMRFALCTAIASESALNVLEPGVSEEESLALLILDEVLFLSKRPDIILLALGNPGRDELKALQALSNTLPSTPILALISNEVPGQEQAALEAGAQAVLTKAASRAELICALRELRAKALSDYSENQLEREANETTS